MNPENKQILDGCTAAAYVAYAMSDVATVYPITPIASMGQTAQKWAMKGIKNYAGSRLVVKEMESELGAAGATHGALAAGSLATTFTSSQGLLLMIPNMYKIAGELLPAVFHVGCRSVATHALSIFGDHSDVMACSATGFAILAANSVQETVDMAIVSHLAALEGSVPVLHMMDGWRTSNQMSTVELPAYADIFSLINKDALANFHRRAMNPEHPDLRGSAQNADVYFQNREACNSHYLRFPEIVQQKMDAVAALTGRQYHLVDYVGAPEAEYVVVAIGSSCEVLEQTIAKLNADGGKYGLVKIRLYRPFPEAQLIEAIPSTVKRIAVLDRTKEPGAPGEPLYRDVASAIHAAGRDIKVYGGRYGLSSKEFDPTMAAAVCAMLSSDSPRSNFTVGINDDVTHLSIPLGSQFSVEQPGMLMAAQFYGFGSDGMVGATRQLASILSSSDNLYCQAYFEYSAKKSGGYTVSQLRVAQQPIRAAYNIEEANFVICARQQYLHRFEIAGNIAHGGTLLISTSLTADQMNTHLPALLRRRIAGRGVKLYNIDAAAIARRHNLGPRINAIMATAFLYLSDIIPFSESYPQLQQQVRDNYAHEGSAVVDDNLAAMAEVVASLQKIDYPASWAQAEDTPQSETHVPPFVKNIAEPCNKRLGNSLPVSLFNPAGIMPPGTTAYEKRAIAAQIPVWDSQKCIQCTLCSLVCAHAAIRPYLLDAEEKKNAPADLVTVDAHGKAMAGYQYRIQVYSLDCTGCGSCATICPGHALTMTDFSQAAEAQVPLLDYIEKNVSYKEDIMPRNTIYGSQICQPMLEFSGACAGCGETPYVKLITQMFGQHMIIANATGCSSIWGADFPSNPYTCSKTTGHGPAWGNSLFEDNAEYGFGMATAVKYRRALLIADVKALAAADSTSADVKTAAQAWLAAVDDLAKSYTLGQQLVAALQKEPATDLSTRIIDNADLLGRKSIWAIGGDGWAYDIGFAGLDHVLAEGENINILVLDTECYSNTGGQMSKATPLGAVAKYAPDGKRTIKKDLGRMMMTYGNVYVASVCLGANYAQTLRAMAEAEAYPGPSIVIAYCPCIMHGIRTGMGSDIVEEKRAVATGYWTLYRYNPALTAEGKSPLEIDSPAPDTSQLSELLDNEDRYADLRMLDLETSDTLQAELATHQASLYRLMTAESSAMTPTPGAQ